MQITLVILVIALIAKDIAYLSDPFILRGTAQALCLFVGGGWLAGHFSAALFKRYWTVFAYLLALVLATYGTRDPIFVALQVVSLAAMAIFAIAYFETRRQGSTARSTNATLIRTTVIMYAIVAWLSLAAAHYWPSVAYQQIHLGNVAGTELRVTGLFSQAGMMGGAAGLLVVLSLFGLKSILAKLVFVFPGVICLGMTFSRTYWVAAIVSAGLTLFFYQKAGRKWLVTAMAASAIAIAAAAAFDLQFDRKAVRNLVRAESVSNLTGRFTVWERALMAFERHPYLGYGFTAGALGLVEERQGANQTIGEATELSSRNVSRATMHSGYVQSLLDSGAIGTFFYLLVMALSIRRIYVYDKSRAFPAEFAGLIFLVVANLSENAIYSAAVYSSVLFWILAVFGLSLQGAQSRPEEQQTAELRA